jgi:hypothetical protein
MTMLGQQGTAAMMFDPEKEYEIIDGIPKKKEMAGARHGSLIVLGLGAGWSRFDRP